MIAVKPDDLAQPNDQLTHLIYLHQVTLSERVKAQLEAQIWELASTEDRQSVGRRNYMHNVLAHEKTGNMEDRALLHNANVEALWQRVTLDKMPLTTAVRRLRAAQGYASTHKIDLDKAVTVALEEYDSWPQHKTRTGITYRRRPMSQVARARVGKIAKRVHTGRRKIEPVSEERVRDFWSTIRTQIAGFLAQRLIGIDPITANKLQRDFCTDLQTLYDEHSARIDRTRREIRMGDDLSNVVKFVRVREACELLAIDPPTRGTALNLAQANKNKKRLAREYHPDIAGETKREQYHAVLDAFATLESYMEQISEATCTT